MAQMVEHLPAMRETWVHSLAREDPLEKEMATHSSTLAWKIPWTEEPCRLQSMGSQRVGHDWTTSLHFLIVNLQCCVYSKVMCVCVCVCVYTASLVTQSVKNLPAMQETWVWFLDGEDPLEKEMATHFSILAWEIPQTEEPGRLQSMGSQELDMT